MKRKEFERVTPESVGITSRSIENLIEKLENGGYTEPHGLMIMRHGKICAEGWWAPYAPGIRHGLQSHTKTYAATAVGIAYTEGLLKLDERIIDIFADVAPENPSENLKKVTVHHVLCMGVGMETMPRPSMDWIRDFLATPVVHEPGTAYMYNSTGSSLLCAIVKKKTGLGMLDYLKPRLFDKIGINAENLRCMTMPDGIEVGGGGLYATTEDNLRLMKLYADGGVWDGERILAEDYVKLATSLQNQSATEIKVNPPAKDNFVGYGYQIWMCRPKGVYRADGAMGQFTIVVPDRDMVIAITECAQGSTGGVGPQKSLDAIWEFLEEIPVERVDPLEENPEAAAHLSRRMKTLAIAAPDSRPYSPIRDSIDGKTFKVTEGLFSFANTMRMMMSGGPAPAGIENFSISFGCDSANFDYVLDGKAQSLRVALDGSRAYNLVDGADNTIALVSGYFLDDNTFRLVMRWIETTGERSFDFKFDGENVIISPVAFVSFGRRPAPDCKAVLVK